MSPTFHPFPRLPAELRTRVWHIALQDEYDNLSGSRRVIEFYDYNTSLEEIAVKVSRRYPTPFEVNKEARYEAAKTDGGNWITVQARFDGKKEPGATTEFTICINFERDTIFLSERFSRIDTETLLLHGLDTPEEVRLDLLSSLLGKHAMGKITRLTLHATRAPGKSYTRWCGRGLERFGALSKVHVVSMDTFLIRTLKQTLGAYVRSTWKRNNKTLPELTFFFDEDNEDDDALFALYEEHDAMFEIDGLKRTERGQRNDFGKKRG